MYGLKESYKITPNTEAADFLENIVKEYFNYISHSKRQKYADIWLSQNHGINVKTVNLSSKTVGPGRICTAEINQWLRHEDNNLEIIFIEYSNDNGLITIQNVTSHWLEELEYYIMNQGRGLLMSAPDPRKNRTSVLTRPRISRQQWLDEFSIKYSDFVDKQIKILQGYKKDWCHDTNLKNTLTNFFE